MRAIDAENIRIKPEFMHNVCGMAMIRVEDVVRILNEQPTIQPKRGKWIEDKGQQTLMRNFIEMGEVWRVCSVCGAGHMIGHKYAIDKAYHDRHHNFCPNCGARMEVDNGQND